MIRSIIIALGIMAIVVGFECLAIDSATIYEASETRTVSFFNPSGAPAQSSNVWEPKDWMPWAMISGGVITIIYSFLVPRRWRRWRGSVASS